MIVIREHHLKEAVYLEPCNSKSTQVLHGRVITQVRVFPRTFAFLKCTSRGRRPVLSRHGARPLKERLVICIAGAGARRFAKMSIVLARRREKRSRERATRRSYRRKAKKELSFIYGRWSRARKRIVRFAVPALALVVFSLPNSRELSRIPFFMQGPTAKCSTSIVSNKTPPDTVQ